MDFIQKTYSKTNIGPVVTLSYEERQGEKIKFICLETKQANFLSKTDFSLFININQVDTLPGHALLTA